MNGVTGSSSDTVRQTLRALPPLAACFSMRLEATLPLFLYGQEVVQHLCRNRIFISFHYTLSFERFRLRLSMAVPCRHDFRRLAWDLINFAGQQLTLSEFIPNFL